MSKMKKERLLDRVLESFECEEGKCKLTKINEDIYLFNGILYTNDFYNISRLLADNKESLHLHRDSLTFKFNLDSYVIKNGSAVVILGRVSFFEEYIDYLKKEDFIELFQENEVDINIFNGKWWVRQPSHLIIDIDNMEPIKVLEID